MRNLKIPRTEIFLLDRGIGKQFAASLYNRSTQPRCSGCARSVRSIGLIHGFRRQDARNRQHFGCEKSSTNTPRREPKISRAAKPPRRLPMGHASPRWATPSRHQELESALDRPTTRGKIRPEIVSVTREAAVLWRERSLWHRR